MCVAEMRHHAAPQSKYVHIGTQTDYTFSAPAPVVEYHAPSLACHAALEYVASAPVLLILPHTKYLHIWSSLWHPCSRGIEQLLEFPVPLFQEQNAEMVNVFLQERISERFMVQVVDGPVPQVVEDTVKMMHDNNEAPTPVIEYVAPVPVEYRAPAPSVTCAAQAPWTTRMLLRSPCPTQRRTNVSAPPRTVTYVAPAPVLVYVEYFHPAPVDEFVAPAPAVSCAALVPVVDHIALAALTYVAPAPAVEYVDPAPAVTYATSASAIGHVVPVPVDSRSACSSY